MAITHMPGLVVVSVLFTNVDHMVGRRNIRHDTEGKSVACIWQIPALEKADYRHVEIVHVRLKPYAFEGMMFLFIIMNMRIAGIPVQRR